jgi:hypothetical protein
MTALTEMKSKTAVKMTVEPSKLQIAVALPEAPVHLGRVAGIKEDNACTIIAPQIWI